MKLNMYLLLLSFVLILSLSIQAQDGERLEQLKIAFLTEQLDLSVSEGQSFWPVYNTFQKEKQSLERERKEASRVIKDKGDGVTEKEIREVIAAVHASKVKEEALEKKFIEDCLPILGPAKTGKLMLSEHEFKKQMMDRLRDRQEGRPGPPRRN